MNWGRLFACCSLCLSLGAAVGWYYQGEYRKAIYWLGASVINATFVF